MLTSYLFPHRFKRLGWLLVLVSLTLGLLELYDVVQLPHLLGWLPSLIGSYDSLVVSPNRLVRANHDLYAVLFICGGLLVACTREQHEDEYISKIRLASLLWALYTYYALLMLAFLLVSGISFFTVMTYALFAPLLLFLVRFQLLLYFASRRLSPHD